MNLQVFNFFALFKKENAKSKASVLLQKKEDDKIQETKAKNDSLKKYTLVNSVDKKVNLLTTINSSNKQLGAASVGRKDAHSHWHVNKSEQQYQQKQVKLDPQIEFNYQRLGLGKS